jgi:hypothetical protein
MEHDFAGIAGHRACLTIRGPNAGTGTSSDQGAASMTASAASAAD